MQDDIEDLWDNKYGLIDVYLSIRRNHYGVRNVDLLRISAEEAIRTMRSQISIEAYFQKIARRHGRDSLLTKVFYCKRDYGARIGTVDFFEHLDHETRRAQRGNRSVIAEALDNLRKNMKRHARDFPFPAPWADTEGFSIEAHRERWCEANLPLWRQ